jgi:uncharacterized membrane protein YhaH (DUF805 family)
LACRILAVGIGLFVVALVLFLPMKGSDYSDEYGMINYALFITFVTVLNIIAVPMIWHHAAGMSYAFCLCLLTSGIAAVRWHWLGQHSLVVVKATPGETSAEQRP